MSYSLALYRFAPHHSETSHGLSAGDIHSSYGSIAAMSRLEDSFAESKHEETIGHFVEEFGTASHRRFTTHPYLVYSLPLLYNVFATYMYLPSSTCQPGGSSIFRKVSRPLPNAKSPRCQNRKSSSDIQSVFSVPDLSDWYSSGRRVGAENIPPQAEKVWNGGKSIT